MPETWDEACRELIGKLADLLISKQHDYGHGNINAFGEFGCLVRANDKMARLRNLYNKGKDAKNESIDDSWFDLAGYSIIALMLRNGTFGLDLEKD